MKTKGRGRVSGPDRYEGRSLTRGDKVRTVSTDWAHGCVKGTEENIKTGEVLNRHPHEN